MSRIELEAQVQALGLENAELRGALKYIANYENSLVSWFTDVAIKALEVPPSHYARGAELYRKLRDAAKEHRIHCLGSDAITGNMVEKFDSALDELEAWEKSK